MLELFLQLLFYALIYNFFLFLAWQQLLMPIKSKGIVRSLLRVKTKCHNFVIGIGQVTPPSIAYVATQIENK